METVKNCAGSVFLFFFSEMDANQCVFVALDMIPLHILKDKTGVFIFFLLLTNSTKRPKPTMSLSTLT